MTTSDLLEYDIYPRLDRSEALQELDPQDKGNHYLLTCPSCDKREAFIYKSGYAIKCNRLNNCGESVSLWNHIQRRDSLSQQDTLKELARLAGVTLPTNGKIDAEEIEKRNKKISILEQILNKCQDELRKSPEAIEYLKTRNFTLDEALSLGIGYYSDNKTITNDLDIEGLEGLEYQSWEKRIIGLWRSSSGQPMTVWGRDITNKQEKKYYYLYGEKQDRPYGLDKAYGKEIIAVEGILDALSLQKNGVEGVIATGRSTLTEDQIKAIKKARKTSVTLNLDNDDAGYKGIESAIDRLEAEGIKSYVVEPSLMGVKDPDEYICKEGLDAYKTLLDKAQRGVEWKIYRLGEKHSTETAKGRDVILLEGTELLNKTQDPVTYDYGIKRLSSLLDDMPVETIAQMCTDVEKKKKEKFLERERQAILGKALNDEIEGEALITALREVDAKAARVTITPLIDFIDEKRAKDEARQEGALGYKLVKFKNLCEHIDGLQTGYYLIAGETNTGKTAFLVNLFLDVLDSNADVCGLYFSLDDNKEIILNRMLAIKASLEINKTQKPVTLDPLEKTELDGAYKSLKALVSLDRFYLEDISSIDNITILESYIQAILSKGKNIFVAIDGLYNLSVGNGAEGLRGENIERANRIKALVDTYKIPIICTGELRKRTSGGDKDKPPTINDLMETGKFAYNANLVLLLYPPDRDALEADQDDIMINCKYAKNKLSWYRGVEDLSFKRKLSIVEEKDVAGSFNPYRE